MPKRHTNRKMMPLAVVMANHRSVYHGLPQSVSGTNFKEKPPGNTARSTCRMFIPIKPRTPHIPLSLTQTRNLFGIRYKMNQGTPDKISDQDYKNNGNDSQYPFDLFCLFLVVIIQVEHLLF